MRLATGPVSWGVDFADSPANPPWQQVLDEVATSPLRAMELGPVGYLPEEPAALRQALDERALRAVGSFVFEDFHDPARAEEVIAVTRRVARMIAAAGGEVLVLIDKPSEERAATAGDAAAARRLPDPGWQQMVALVERGAEVARVAGLCPVVHPHAGGYLEFADEIERLLAATDLDLCIDTGHSLYAGIDPESIIGSYAERLRHVHLKDVDGEVLSRVRSQGWGFWTAISEGVFCPIGEGALDLPGVLRALRAADYDGFATIEQDRTPGSGSPLADLEASVSVVAKAEASSESLANGS